MLAEHFVGKIYNFSNIHKKIYTHLPPPHTHTHTKTMIITIIRIRINNTCIISTLGTLQPQSKYFMTLDNLQWSRAQHEEGATSLSLPKGNNAIIKREISSTLQSSAEIEMLNSVLKNGEREKENDKDTAKNNNK